VQWWGKNDLLAPDAFNGSVTQASSKGGGNNGENIASDPSDNRFFTFLSKPATQHTNGTTDYNNVAQAIAYITRWDPDADPPFSIFLPLTKPHPPYSTTEPFYSAIDPASLPPLRPQGAGKPDYHALIRSYRNTSALDEAFFRQLHAVYVRPLAMTSYCLVYFYLLTHSLTHSLTQSSSSTTRLHSLSSTCGKPNQTTRYLGSIAFSDFLFGLLLAAVDEAQLADSTTVAVWADHGDYAGDYGLVEKWPSGLEDVLTRVPLLVRTPGGARGHVVTSPVQLFDIVPTFLDLAGINLTHVQFGVSQKDQILRGAPGDDGRAVFAEGGYATNEPRDFEGDPSTGGTGSRTAIYYPKLMQQQEHPLSVCRAASVRTLTHKLVFRTDPTDADHDSELYDLVADPLELSNVYGNASYAAVQAALKEKLFLWFMQTSDVTPWLEDPRGGNMPFGPHAAAAQGGKAHDVAADTPSIDRAHVWH